MAKKLSLLLVIGAVFAVAAPAMASVGPALTMPAGTLVSTGTHVVNTSTNLTIKASPGTIECALASIEWKVVENTGLQMGGTGLGKGQTVACDLEGREVQVTDLTLQSIFSPNAGEGSLRPTFEVDFPEITCHFKWTPGGLAFTSALENDEIDVAAQEMEANPAACGPAEIEATFTMETGEEGGGGPVTLGSGSAHAAALTMSPGTLLSLGTTFVGTSNNFSVATSFGTLSCSQLSFTAEVTQNDGSTVHSLGLGQGSSGGCVLEGGEVEFTDITLQSLDATAVGEASVYLTFEVDLPGVTCHFESKPAGTKATHVVGESKFTIPKQKLEATPAICRPGEIGGTFAVETEDGTSVTLD
jgi:hypothetical protein